MGRLLSLFLTLVIYGSSSAAMELSDNWEASIRGNQAAELWRMANQTDAASRATREGKTLLMAAASLGDLRLVEHLIRRGAPVNASNERGGTALMYAAAQGHLSVIETLIAAGADVNQHAENGWTAILLASAKGFEIVIQHLLFAKADPNQIDMFGYTPLMRAIANGKAGAVGLLIDQASLDFAIKNTQGQNALELAIESGSCELSRTLMSAYIEQRLAVSDSARASYGALDCPG